jgi:hypothetical protein
LVVPLKHLINIIADKPLIEVKTHLGKFFEFYLFFYIPSTGQDFLGNSLDGTMEVHIKKLVVRLGSHTLNEFVSISIAEERDR